MKQIALCPCPDCKGDTYVLGSTYYDSNKRYFAQRYCYQCGKLYRFEYVKGWKYSPKPDLDSLLVPRWRAALSMRYDQTQDSRFKVMVDRLEKL